MYLLIVFLEPTKETIIFSGIFENIHQIIKFSNKQIRYTDIQNSKKKFSTYKDLFQVIKL